MPVVSHLIAGLARLLIPLAFDLRCAEPVLAPKLSLWLFAGAVAVSLRSPYRTASMPFRALQLWAAWLLLSALAAGVYDGWIWVLTVLCGVACGPWLAGNYAATLRWALGGWGLTATYSWVQRLGWDPMQWSFPALSRDRTIAGLGNPNYLSMYLAALLPLVWCWAYRRGAGACALVCAGWVTLILTATRGSVLAVGAVLAAASLLAAWRRQGSGRFLAVTWAAFLVGLGSAWVLGPLLAPESTTLPSSRVQATGRGDSSVQARLLLWQSAWRIGGQHPLLGVGPGRFGVHYLHQRPLEPEALRVLQRLPEDPHNEPMRVWSETGVVGALLWLAWVVTAGTALLRRLPVVAAGWAVLMLNGLTNSFPLAVWPLLAWWTALAGSASAPAASECRARVRPWGVPLALLMLLCAGGTWISQRTFWWDDDYALSVGPGSSRAQVEESATRRRSLLLGLDWVCPPFYRPERARRLSEASLELLRSGSRSISAAEPVAWARRRISMDPQNPYAWQGLAMVSDGEEAQAAWRQANRYDPRNPAVLFFLARALARTGKTGEALTRIQESLEINSKSAQVYQLRAQIMIEQGQSWEGYWDWVRGCQYR